ncbi:MAG: ACP S-malonyltransferase [Chloroflexota bacterium]
MRIALVFPGQGSQTVGMVQALREGAGGEVFRAVDRALGEDLGALIANGPAERLDLTENSQPAILAASIAIHRRWAERAAEAGLPAPMFFAGHSMGQYSAMVAAGVLELEDAVRLVRERGRLMQASPAGSMAAIIGLDDGRLPELVSIGSAAGVFTVANRNSPGQVVVSGEVAAVQAATEAAKGLGAKRAIMLPISIAAHSPLMAAAAEGMREAVARVPFHDPVAPLLANADARPLTTADDCRSELIDHLTQGVDWVRAIEVMRVGGVDAFVEVGPGKVLTNLTKRIDPTATTVVTDDPSAPDGIADPAALLEPTE